MNGEDLPISGWGSWTENRCYPSKDGLCLIVIWKRVDESGQVYWKNTRRPLSRLLSRADRAYYEAYPENQLSADGTLAIVR